MSFFHGLIAASSYVLEYKEVLDYAGSQGFGRPAFNVRNAQNAYMKLLVESGILATRDVYYEFTGDGSDDYKCINWKSPGNFQITKVNSPTFQFAGAAGAFSSYLNTNWIPGTHGVNFTQNNASMIVDASTNINHVDGMVDAGCSNVNNNNSVFIHSRSFADTFTSRINDNSTLSVANSSSIGSFMVRRTASNVREALKNGVVLVSDSQVSVPPALNPLFISCFNSNGTPLNFSTRVLKNVNLGSAMVGLEGDYLDIRAEYENAIGL